MAPRKASAKASPSELPAAAAPDVRKDATDDTASAAVGPSANTASKDASTPTEGAASQSADEGGASEKEDAPPLPLEIAPPLPVEQPPPLPDEAPPGPTAEDDGWAPVWDATANSYYFYNRFTQASQWENPRVPDRDAVTRVPQTDPDRVAQPQYAPGTEPTTAPKLPVAGGYNPAIHGDYDPNADYAILAQQEEEQQQTHDPYSTAPPGLVGQDPAAVYAQQASFNRFTGRFTNTTVHPTHTPDQHTDDAKSKRQMNAFFDVDAAANSHGGKSLRAERQERKLSKKELKEFREKRRSKKEEKRRAWLKD